MKSGKETAMPEQPFKAQKSNPPSDPQIIEQPIINNDAENEQTNKKQKSTFRTNTSENQQSNLIHQQQHQQSKIVIPLDILQQNPLQEFIPPPIHRGVGMQKALEEMQELSLNPKAIESFLPFGEMRPMFFKGHNLQVEGNPNPNNNNLNSHLDKNINAEYGHLTANNLISSVEINRQKSIESEKQKRMVITNATKDKLKKDVTEIYQKMLYNLKICAGQTSEKDNANTLMVIDRKFQEFFAYLNELKIGETRLAVLRELQKETQEMNKQSEENQIMISEMKQFCENQQQMKAERQSTLQLKKKSSSMQEPTNDVSPTFQKILKHQSKTNDKFITNGHGIKVKLIQDSKTLRTSSLAPSRKPLSKQQQSSVKNLSQSVSQMSIDEENQNAGETKKGKSPIRYADDGMAYDEQADDHYGDDIEID